MALSNWNQWLERMLAADLTVAEHRLALAVARQTLGYNKTEARIGRPLLCAATRLTSRSVERARDGLISKGLIRYEAGSRGRYGRSVYTLVLAEPIAALQRQIEQTPIAAVERHLGDTSNCRSGDTPIAAVERQRKEKRKGKSIPAAPAVDLRPIFDAYIACGGSLDLERDRKALARNAKSLIDDGVPLDTVVAAARDLGRERTFPGYLKQRVAELAAAGGPCAWHGLDRSRLTLAQLRSCACTPCTDWANAKAASGIGAAA